MAPPTTSSTSAPAPASRGARSSRRARSRRSPRTRKASPASTSRVGRGSPSPQSASPPTDRRLRVANARHHNLKGIDVEVPLGLFVCVTGVSGSGKSSLVGDILRDALHDLNGAQAKPGERDQIEGADQLDKVIDIDQSPIGRTRTPTRRPT